MDEKLKRMIEQSERHNTDIEIAIGVHVREDGMDLVIMAPEHHTHERILILLEAAVLHQREVVKNEGEQADKLLLDASKFHHRTTSITKK